MDFLFYLSLWGKAVQATTGLVNALTSCVDGFLSMFVPTLIGAFGGGYGAHALYLRSNRQKTREEQVGSALEILLDLVELFDSYSFAVYSAIYSMDNRQMSKIQPRQNLYIKFSKLTFLAKDFSFVFGAIRDLNSKYQEVVSCVEEVNNHYENESHEEYLVFMGTIVSGYEQATSAYIEAYDGIREFLKINDSELCDAVFEERHKVFEETLEDARRVQKDLNLS